MIEHQPDFNQERHDLDLKITRSQSSALSIKERIKMTPLSGEQMYKLHKLHDGYLREIEHDAVIVISMDMVEIMVWANETMSELTPLNPRNIRLLEDSDYPQPLQDRIKSFLKYLAG